MGALDSVSVSIASLSYPFDGDLGSQTCTFAPSMRLPVAIGMVVFPDLAGIITRADLDRLGCCLHPRVGGSANEKEKKTAFKTVQIASNYELLKDPVSAGGRGVYSPLPLITDQDVTVSCADSN